MRQVHHPVIVNYNKHLYRLSPSQWQRLAPALKGLNSKQQAFVGRAFLGQEGILKEVER